MGFTTDPSCVRVDFFKESGKWYTTESVRIIGYFKPSSHGALIEALNEHLSMPEEPRRLRYSGMSAVCIEMYHQYSVPLMVRVPDEGKFLLSAFDAESGK